MAQKSKPIKFYDEEKLKNINPETLKLWRKYQIDMELRELSPRSISGYYNDLCHWWIYIYDNQGNIPITELDENDITEFLYFCKTQGNNSRRMKRRMSSISAFYKYLRKKKIIAEDPVEFLDRPKKDTDVVVQTFLSFAQVDSMRNKLTELIKDTKTESEKHSALMLRLYAFFSLSTMARVTAVSNTKWAQINFEERIVDDVIEKEGYIVTLYFSQEVAGYLRELMEFRRENNISDDGFVFIATYNGKTGPISTGSLNEWCKRIGLMIGVPTLHPHDFRHSGSQIMKLNGAPIEDISEGLHHQNLDCTRKFYLKSDKKKIRASRDKYGV